MLPNPPTAVPARFANSALSFFFFSCRTCHYYIAIFAAVAFSVVAHAVLLPPLRLLVCTGVKGRYEGMLFRRGSTDGMHEEVLTVGLESFDRTPTRLEFCTQ